MDAAGAGPLSLWVRGHRRLVGGLAIVLLAAAAYSALLRPWYLGWGATETELDSVYPGDDRVPRPRIESTRAIRMERPPEDVFPWLVQMGQQRGGFYSYEWLENLVGCEIRNADRIHPEWRILKPGDAIGLHPKLRDAFRVEAIHPPRYLLLQGGAAGQSVVATWLFYLMPESESATRLVVRSRTARGGSIADTMLWRLVEPIHFFMERGMLLGIRDRVQASPAKTKGPN